MSPVIFVGAGAGDGDPNANMLPPHAAVAGVVELAREGSGALDIGVPKLPSIALVSLVWNLSW